MNRHIDYIDYCKAFGAVLIIMVHSGLNVLTYLAIFLMPMFFALSGFVYDPDKRTASEYIKGRFMRLVIPFWVLSVMYMIVEAVRSHVLGYGAAKNLLTFPMYMAYGSSILPKATGLTEAAAAYAYPYPLAAGRVYLASPSANHLWFLPALFAASIMFCIAEKYTRKGLLVKLLAVAALLLISFFDSAVSFCLYSDTCSL